MSNNILKNNILKMVIVSIALSVSSAWAKNATYKAKSTIAKVGKAKIYAYDINAEFSGLPPQMQQQGFKELAYLLRQSVIEKELIAQDAERKKIKNSLEYKAAIRKARRDILLRLYLDKNLDSKVTDKQLKSAYKKLKKELGDNEQVRARHILVKSRVDAEKIIRALDDGADFDSLAKSKSKGPSGKKGGDLGYFSRGQMVPAFENVAFNLKDDTYTTKPIKTQFGWHVIKRIASRKQPVPSFDDSKDFLTKKIQETRIAMLTKKLAKKTKVRFYDEKGKVIK